MIVLTKLPEINPIKDKTCYIVSTPIGCLSDITLRALNVLQQVACIYCEDTRHTKRLLESYQITTPTVSLNAQNEAQKIDQITDRLSSGESIAIVSDAGTPLIQDPGTQTVRVIRERGFTVSPIPGPNAVITAISAAGLNGNQFVFVGFLPNKTEAKRTLLSQHKLETKTIVFYETPHRIENTLHIINEIMPSRSIVIAKELTKLYENFLTGSAKDILARFDQDPKLSKGEMVVLIEGADSQTLIDGDTKNIQLLAALLDTLPAKEASKVMAKISDKPKKYWYELSLTMKN